ncbi:MAG: hypothetical protein IT236_08490 [Bacteroidia bacterium]|nr:hypothetical protein [Bacteroidia bacterium]
MEEKEINPQESLALIDSMIQQAKHKLADDGFYFIFWGWLITICALANYIAIQFGIYEGYWVWIILPPLGGIVSAIYGRKEKKNKKVITHVDTYMSYVVGGFLTALIITLVFMPWHGIKVTYFVLMLLYGISTLITGGILNFKPLIIGSLFSFAFAALSVFLGNAEQFLCISGSLIFSHIIPGHLLRSSFKTQNV